MVHGTIISAEHVAQVDRTTGEAGISLNLKTFIADLDVPVIAGGVLDHHTALHLMRTGAAGVIVGYGSTADPPPLVRFSASGCRWPQPSPTPPPRRDYLDETGGRYVHVIADGDIHTSGDLIKAIACGADAAVLGTRSPPPRRHPAAAGTGRRRRHPTPRVALQVATDEDRPDLAQGSGRAVRRPVRRTEPHRRAAPGRGKAGYCDPGVPGGAVPPGRE